VKIHTLAAKLLQNECGSAEKYQSGSKSSAIDFNKAVDDLTKHDVTNKVNKFKYDSNGKTVPRVKVQKPK